VHHPIGICIFQQNNFAVVNREGRSLPQIAFFTFLLYRTRKIKCKFWENMKLCKCKICYSLILLIWAFDRDHAEVYTFAKKVKSKIMKSKFDCSFMSIAKSPRIQYSFLPNRISDVG
jgi:hypothetical protein